MIRMILMICCLFCVIVHGQGLNNQPLLDAFHYKKLPTSQEINAFLSELARESVYFRWKEWGKTAGGRPFGSLLASKDLNWLKNPVSDSKRLTVLLVGSQHGTEPAGAEALQQFVWDLARGHRTDWDDMNFILVVNANPDGRDNHTRRNAAQVNINIDFVTLKSPEARYLVDILNAYYPDVVFDLHESSVVKSVLTHKQGFMTTFSIQYEGGNNPNIAPSLRTFTQDVLLPNLLAISQKAGLDATHYRGEILSLDQPVSHGGLRMVNLRNYAAAMGAVSFLVESRLDPPMASYATPHNIKGRRDRAYDSLKSFLLLIHQHQHQIKAESNAAKKAFKEPFFYATAFKKGPYYALNKTNPRVPIMLESVRTHQKMIKYFPNYDRVRFVGTVKIPKEYRLSAQSVQFDEAKRCLKDHHIAYRQLKGGDLSVSAYQLNALVLALFSLDNGCSSGASHAMSKVSK